MIIVKFSEWNLHKATVFEIAIKYFNIQIKIDETLSAFISFQKVNTNNLSENQVTKDNYNFKL